MPIPIEEWSKRVDKANALHESALRQVVEMYELCKTIQQQETQLLTTCESLRVKTDAKYDAAKVKAEQLLADVQEYKVKVEGQFQKCVQNAQEIGGFKMQVEHIVSMAYDCMHAEN